LVTLTAALPGKSAVHAPSLAAKESLLVSSGSISAGVFVELSSKDFSKVVGRKLNFKERIALGLVQKKFKAEIKAGHLTADTVINLNQLADEKMPQFNIGGFLLGFFLGLIGVALAYIFSNDKGFRRNSWYGLGAWLILVVIAVMI